MASIQLSFGKCIRFYRNKIGLSQEKFALLINMDRTYYASVEAGKRNISIANIEKIANGLGVPIHNYSCASKQMRRRTND